MILGTEDVSQEAGEVCGPEIMMKRGKIGWKR